MGRQKKNSSSSSGSKCHCTSSSCQTSGSTCSSGSSGSSGSSSSCKKCSCGKKCRCCRGPQGPVGPQGNPGSGANLFGNGADGDFTDCLEGPDSVTLLDRDYYFNNLEICGTLCTNGYRIFVRNTFTLRSTGMVCNNGGDGNIHCGGNGAPMGTLGGGGGGGCMLVTAQDLDVPIAGGIGGFGNLPPGVPTPYTHSSGGVTVFGANKYQDQYYAGFFNHYPENSTGRTLDAVQVYGGTGGGGNNLGQEGGGGGGGGVVGIYAFRLAADDNGVGGMIQARGGNGYSGNGQPTNPPLATGGGGGGAIIISYAHGNPNAYTYDVSGGLAGGFGQNGNPGNVFKVNISDS